MKCLVKSEKIRLVAKCRDIALYSCVNQNYSESKSLGNYICMDKIKIVHMLTTSSHVYDNTNATLPMKNVTATNNDSVTNDILT